MNRLASIITLSSLLLIQKAKAVEENNLELYRLQSQLERISFEQKISRSSFLPELSLSGGLGSEKLIDNAPETERGPFVFLEGKLNLYRGGRDQNSIQETRLKIVQTNQELEIKKRALSRESFGLLSEIAWLKKDNALIEEELKISKTQQFMARKKVDAGLTTSVDLLDFDLKNQNLENEREKNLLKIENHEKDLLALFGNKLTLADIEKLTQEEITATSPELAQAKSALELSQLEKSSARAEYLPSIDLSAKWGQITPQEKFLAPNREHQMALTLTIPLFSGFSTDARIQQAITMTSLNERVLRQTEIDLKNKKSAELRKINLSKKILASLEHSLGQALKYRDLTIGEYKRGIKNSPDVIAASDKKLEIERKIIENQHELNVSQYTYNQIQEL